MRVMCAVTSQSMRQVDAKRGLLLREARQRERMTHVELAVASGVSVGTISNLENGKRAANESTWRALQQVLGPLPSTPVTNPV